MLKLGDMIMQINYLVWGREREAADFPLSITRIEGVPLPLGAWDRLRYFIVALPGSSI